MVTDLWNGLKRGGAGAAPYAAGVIVGVGITRAVAIASEGLPIAAAIATGLSALAATWAGALRKWEPESTPQTWYAGRWRLGYYSQRVGRLRPLRLWGW